MLSLSGIKDLSQYCRVCLNRPDEDDLLDLDLIYDEDEHINYYDCFTICTNVNINDGERLPHNLCKSCGIELQMVYDFHKKVQDAMHILQQWQEESNISLNKSVSVKCEIDSFLDIVDEEIVQIDASQEIKEDTSDVIPDEIEYTLSNEFEVLNDDLPIGEPEKSIVDCQEHLDFEIFPKEIKEDAETFQSAGSIDKDLISPFLIDLPDGEANSSINIDVKEELDAFEKILEERGEINSLIYNREDDNKDFWPNEEVFPTSISIATVDGPVESIKAETLRRRIVGRSVCEYCSKEFKNHSRMLLHRKCHEINRIKYPCDECGRVYITKQAMLAHKKTVHSKKGYVCTVCQKIYSVKKCLEIHMRFHTGEFPYECDICNKKFAQFSHLKTHNNVKHNNVRFGCQFPNCGKLFTSSSSLRNHEFSHSIMPFECSFCQRGYPAKAKLKAHIKRSHKKDLTMDELETMRKFQVLRSKLNMVQLVDPEL